MSFYCSMITFSKPFKRNFKKRQTDETRAKNVLEMIELIIQNV